MNIQLETGEVVIKEVRVHIFFLILDILSLAGVAIMPLLIAFTLLFIPALFPLTIIMWSAWALYPLWLLLVWIQFGTVFTFYYLHYLVITNERIIEVEQRSFFNREVSTFRLENIQDITVKSEGILASILNFGDLHIQTASKQNDFTVKNASRPEAIKMLINEQHDGMMKRFNQRAQV